MPRDKIPPPPLTKNEKEELEELRNTPRIRLRDDLKDKKDALRLEKQKLYEREKKIKQKEADLAVAEGKNKVVIEDDPSEELLQVIEDAVKLWVPDAGLEKYLREVKKLPEAEIQARLPGVQSRFLASPEDEVLFSGGRGSGKSDCLIVDPLRFCDNKNFRGLLLRRTMPELRELIGRAKDLYPQVFPGVKWKEQEKLFVFPSGAKMEYGYADKLDDVLRYQGQQYTWLGIDEITQWVTSEILDKLKASLRTSDPTLRIYIRATTNPSGPGVVWVRERWVDMEPPEERINLDFKYNDETFTVTRKWFHSTIEDNPTLMAANPNYKATLAAIENEALREAWAYGSWDMVEGIAFTEFRDNLHVCKPFEIPREWYRFRACDWGYGSMAVCLWLAVDYDNNIYVYREFATNNKLYGTGKYTADKFAEKILELERYDNVQTGILDSSTWAKRGEVGETPADTMNRMGLAWYPSDRGPGTRKSGKMLIHKYLQVNEDTGQPKIKIFDSCKELIREMKSLPVKHNDPEDVDTDAPDHAYDALRYGLSSRPDIYPAPDNPFGTGSSFSRVDDKPIIINPDIGF